PTLSEGGRPTLQPKDLTLTYQKGRPSPQEGRGQQPWTHPRKTHPEIGRVISHHPSCSGWDIHPIDHEREDTPLDLTCVKFEEILSSTTMLTRHLRPFRQSKVFKKETSFDRKKLQNGRARQ
ncbi:hypothetical protein BHE74_00009476, partial [Ensete ventricosum]